MSAHAVLRWLAGPLVAAWLGWAQPATPVAGAWAWTDGHARWAMSLQPGHEAQAMLTIDNAPDSSWAGRGIWHTAADTLWLVSGRDEVGFHYVCYGDSMLVGRHMFHRVAMYAPPVRLAPTPHDSAAT